MSCARTLAPLRPSADAPLRARARDGEGVTALGLSAWAFLLGPFCLGLSAWAFLLWPFCLGLSAWAFPFGPFCVGLTSEAGRPLPARPPVAEANQQASR